MDLSIFKLLAGLSFFPYKDRFSRSQRSKLVYKASCWDCDSFYVSKTKRRLHDRKAEYFKVLTQDGYTSAVADHGTILKSSLPTCSVKLKKRY